MLGSFAIGGVGKTLITPGLRLAIDTDNSVQDVTTPFTQPVDLTVAEFQDSMYHLRTAILDGDPAAKVEALGTILGILGPSAITGTAAAAGTTSSLTSLTTTMTNSGTLAFAQAAASTATTATTSSIASLMTAEMMMVANGSGNSGAQKSRPVQSHHKVPWNNMTYNHGKHPLVKQAKVNLKRYKKNKMDLGNHIGRHSPEYHQGVQNILNKHYSAVAGK